MPSRPVCCAQQAILRGERPVNVRDRAGRREVDERCEDDHRGHQRSIRRQRRIMRRSSIAASIDTTVRETVANARRRSRARRRARATYGPPSRPAGTGRRRAAREREDAGERDRMVRRGPNAKPSRPHVRVGRARAPRGTARSCRQVSKRFVPPPRLVQRGKGDDERADDARLQHRVHVARRLHGRANDHEGDQEAEEVRDRLQRGRLRARGADQRPVRDLRGECRHRKEQDGFSVAGRREARAHRPGRS